MNNWRRVKRGFIAVCPYPTSNRIHSFNFFLTSGELPPKALGLIVEWTARYQNELMQNWELAVNKKPVNKIDPLV